jgi:hypothetical protein
MAKTKISEFSATSADNTDITNINIAEGCSPANLNNAIRSLMSLLKNQQDGSSGDPFTVAGTLVSSGTVDITGAFRLDGTAGASGQALVSAGSGTPTWSTLGTMASQSASAVAITGGTITGITDLTVADGGTGASSITANSVILGNGTSTLSGNLVAPSTSGNVLTSNGTTWTSAAAPVGITTTTGSALYYGARAFVNFNGTGTVSIRNSSNVSSISDNGIGLYAVNFTTAMADNNYTTVVTARRTDGGAGGGGDVNVAGSVLGSSDLTYNSAVTTTSVKVGTGTVSPALSSDQDCFVAIFR